MDTLYNQLDPENIRSGELRRADELKDHVGVIGYGNVKLRIDCGRKLIKRPSSSSGVK